MCRTLAKNDCPMITITKDIESYYSFYEEIKFAKEVTPLAARRNLR
jgi:hypothetical protein